MAQSATWQMVPLIGLDNFVLSLDPVGPTQTIALLDTANDYIYKSTVGDGGVPSSTVADADGRTGSLKTAFHLICQDEGVGQLVIDGLYLISFALYIPPGVMGLVAGGASAAQLNDSANFPVFDITLFNPLCSAVPTRSLSGISNQRETPATFPFVTNSECWGTDLFFNIGVVGYSPPQFYSGLASTLLDPDSVPGQYGMLTFMMCITPSAAAENPGVTVLAGSALQVVVDFSWTAGN